MNKTIVSFIIALVVVAAASFYGGMIFGKHQASSQRFGQFQNFGGSQDRQGTQTGGMQKRNNSAGFSSGEIINKDDRSITVKLQNGGSKIIFFSAETSVGKAVDGTINDLAVGQNIMANGTANNDGSITAQVIQIRPQTPTPEPNQNPNQGQAPAPANQ